MLLLSAGRTLADVQFTLNQSRRVVRDGRGSGVRWRGAERNHLVKGRGLGKRDRQLAPPPNALTGEPAMHTVRGCARLRATRSSDLKLRRLGVKSSSEGSVKCQH